MKLKKVIIISMFFLFFILNQLIPVKKVSAEELLNSKVKYAIEILALSAGVTWITVNTAEQFVKDVIKKSGKSVLEFNNQLSDNIFTNLKWINDSIDAVLHDYKLNPIVADSSVYQNWLNYPQSIVLTSTSPYQAIYLDPSDNMAYLIVSSNPLYIVNNIMYGGGVMAMYWKRSTQNVWSTSQVFPGLNLQNLSGLVFKESNRDIYTDSSCVSILIPQTTAKPIDFTPDLTKTPAIPKTQVPVGTQVIVSDAVNDNTIIGKSTIAETGALIYTNPALETSSEQTATNTKGIWDTLTGGISNTISSIQTYVKSISDSFDLSLPSSVALDFTPLKVSFQDKFPFSLPWDFANLFTIFSAAPEAPTFHVNFDSRYFLGGGSFDFDFSKYSKLVTILRFFIILEFIYSLILLTKKLPGGSSS
jgi:hypothetical protein